jgi:hypothetical protein
MNHAPETEQGRKGGGGKSMQRFGPGLPSGFSRRFSSLVESRLVSGLAAIALLAMASTASAATVQVLWQENGMSSIAAAAGTPLTAEILITPDAAGISSYGVSIQFDTNDLMLAAAAPERLLPTGFQSNLFTPFPTITGNQISTFDAETLQNGPTSGTFLAGLVHFVAKNPTDDGMNDVTAGFFKTGVDGMFDNAGNSINPQFSGATAVPEPTTALLLVPALAGLAALRRRQLG